VEKTVNRSTGPVGQASLPAEFVDELGQLTQPLEVEEVGRGHRSQARRRVGSVVGRAAGHGGMAAIGQTHEDVRPLPVADTDDRQLLSVERVMGMRDGHESRRRLG
jgi:hypothetical protein